MVIYGDVLFLLDMAADVMLLTAVHRFTGRHLTVCRCLCGAWVGAAGSVFVTVCGFALPISAALSLLLSGLMLTVAFGTKGGWRSFGRMTAILWGAGLLSGGAATFLAARLSLSGGRAGLFLSIAAGIGAVAGLFRVFGWQSHHKSVRLSVVIGNGTAETDALCDTGHLLTEPTSGLPVIFLAAECGTGLMPEEWIAALCERNEEGIVSLPDEVQRRLMPICMRGVCGISFVWGVRADFCSVFVGQNECSFDGYVVFRPGDGKIFGGMGAVIPASAAVL